jgi:hypothetical protein
MPDEDFARLKQLVSKLSGLPPPFYLNEFPQNEGPAFGSPRRYVTEDYDHLYIEQGTDSNATTIGVLYFSDPPEVRLLRNIETQAIK